jgi:hypothetical protein
VRKGKNSRIFDSEGVNGAVTEQKTLSIHTRGGGAHDFTAEAVRVVRARKLCDRTGKLFLQRANGKID